MSTTTDQSFTGSTISTIKEASILCPLCGARFNPSLSGTNICLKCLQTQVDITEGIQKEGIIVHYCKFCERYLGPPWVFAELESKQLLAVCLKKVLGLNKVHLVDASFVWTEPHSKRIKIKLTVQKEILNNTTLQQSFICEFKINYKMCSDCQKDLTPHTWEGCVQIRQKVEHKKTFLLLEQLIMKNKVADKALKIEEAIDGLDFFFKKQDHTRRLVQFVSSYFPCKVKHAKQYIGVDIHSNVSYYKYTTMIDLPKICKDDLVVLSQKFANVLGGWNRVLICYKVSSILLFIDPVNMKILEMTSNTFSQYESEIICIPSKGNMTEFLVTEIEDSTKQKLDQSFVNTRFKPLNLVIARTEDWQNFSVRSFLGDTINEGDTVEGFDLTTFNLDGYVQDIEKIKNLPDIILLKKIYPEKSKKRVWKLNHLRKNQAPAPKKGQADENNDDEYEEFLKEIERDKEMRSQINLYKDQKNLENPVQGKQDGEEQKNEGQHTAQEDLPQPSQKKKNQTIQIQDEVDDDEDTKKNLTTPGQEEQKAGGSKKKRGKKKTSESANLKPQSKPKSGEEQADFPIDDLLDEALEYDDEKEVAVKELDEKIESSQQEKIDKFLDNLTKVKVEGKK